MNYYQDHLITPAPLTLPRAMDTIMVYEPLHLGQVAGVLDIPLKELQDMNPQYRADVIPGTAQHPYAIKFPMEYTASFIDLQDSIFAYKDSVYFDPNKKIAISPELFGQLQGRSSCR